MRGCRSASWSSTWCPPAESCTDAAVTIATSSSPSASVAMCRLRPLIFLPASIPWLVSATLQEVMQGLGGAVGFPLGVVVIDRLVRREVVRQVLPCDPGPAHIQDRVHDLPQII